MYAKPKGRIPDDRLQEAIEKQAKQRALREMLDSQLAERNTDSGWSSNLPTPTTLSKAQLKRQQYLREQLETQQQEETRESVPYEGSGMPPSALKRTVPPQPPRPDCAPPSSGQAKLFGDSTYGNNGPRVPTPPQFGQSLRRPVATPGGAMAGTVHQLDGRQLLDFIGRATSDPTTDVPGGYYPSADPERQTQGNAPCATTHATNGLPPRPKAVIQDAREPARASRQARREAVAELSKVHQLERDLHTHQAQVEKMKEKEKSWEDQVLRLKLELKNAKQKEKELNRLISSRQQLPRAETAPKPQAGNQKKKFHLQPLDVPSRRDHREDFNATLKKSSSDAVAIAQSRMESDMGAPRKYRPITAPNTLDPIQEEPSGPLPPLPMPSLNRTRKPLAGPSCCAMTIDTLLSFVDANIMSRSQADNLWNFLANCSTAERPKESAASQATSPPESLLEHEVVETFDELMQDESDEDNPTYTQGGRYDGAPCGSGEEAPISKEEDESIYNWGQ